MRDIFAKYLKFIGPGLMVSVAYIDPGNYSTAVDAGASNQFSYFVSFCYQTLLPYFCNVCVSSWVPLRD